ncbi:putative MFS-type transporter C18.02 [Pseudocercospora fuligena]|uniref:Putative MFS-type transporter C18.02 n=1 Tax=Pseudocercospora fuligena TaxID=685502 RepID=A0A8H6R5U4_9PEZI|nr:putative MFS-type transporter C18.02 [Pseudocercospora fuligena]
MPTRERLRGFRSSVAFITFVISFSVYTDQFLYAAIVPVTPFALKEHGNISENHTQFWTAILLAVFGIGCFLSSPPWAWYTDHSRNRQIPFIIGLVILMGATVMLWLAPTIHVQIAGRVLQGVASTVVWTTGLAILVDTVGQEQVGEYAGYINIALNMGSLTAPLLGGIMFERRGFNAVFGLILGVIGLDIVFRLIMKERSSSTARNGRPTDLERKGQANTVIETHELAEENLSMASTIVSSSVNPKIPAMIRLLFSVRFLVALWGILVLAAVFSGFETVLPLHVNEIFGWDAEGSGLIFLPLSLPALLGPLIGKVTDRYGGRWFVAGAFVALCPSLVLMRLVKENTLAQKALLVALLIIVGFCLTIILEPLFAEVALRSDQLRKQEIDAGNYTELETSGCNTGELPEAHFKRLLLSNR